MSGLGPAQGTGGSRLPPGYLVGFALAPDEDHGLIVGPGAASDASGQQDLRLGQALVKFTDGAWTAGDQGGALFSGTLAASTWYHVFAIRHASDGTVDAGISTSPTATDAPSGYTAHRRLGSIYVASDTVTTPFGQAGDAFTWVTPVLDVAEAPGTTSAITRALSTPPDVVTEAWVNVSVFVPEDANAGVYLSPLASADDAPSATAAPLFTVLGRMAAAEGWVGAQARCATNTSRQIRLRTNDASAELYVATLGWTDRRGRDG